MTIEQSILNKKLSQNKAQKFSKLFSLYNKEKRKYIYPGAFIRSVGIEMKEAYEILDEIEGLRIIAKSYEIYCPKCKYSTGEIYESLNDLPDEYSCGNCENDIIPIESIIVIYKVLTE